MKPHSHLYVVGLPVVWAATSLAAYHSYAGKGYALWTLASLPGLYPFLFLNDVAIATRWVPLVAAVAGAAVVAPFAFWLDRLALDVRVYGVFWWFAFLALTTQSVYKYGSIPAAVQEHGSFGGFICAGSNNALLATLLFTIALMSWRRAAQRAATNSDSPHTDCQKIR